MLDIRSWNAPRIGRLAVAVAVVTMHLICHRLQHETKFSFVSAESRLQRAKYARSYDFPLALQLP